MIFDQQLKLTIRKSSAPPPPEKTQSSFYSLPPLKNSKSISPPHFVNIEHFSAPHPTAGRGEEDTASHR